MKRQIHPQREQHQQHRQPHDEKAETTRTDLERGGRWRLFQTGGDLANGCALGGTQSQHACRATDHRAAHEDHAVVVSIPVALLGQRFGSGVALHRVRLAGQQGLINEEVLRL